MRVFSKSLSSGWRWLPWASVIILLDQLTKVWVWQHVPLGKARPIFSWLSIVHVHNQGAAFGLFNHAAGWQRWFFLALAISVAVALVWWLRRLPARPVLLPLSWVLILAGALGNAWDRIQYSFVIDFIDVHWHAWHWPAFNIADSAICVGVVCLLWANRCQD